ncbi:MAG: PAS domain S-box protein [Halarchaeum sp.]
MTESDGARATAAEWSWVAVSLLGALLLLVPAYDMWDDVSNLQWQVASTVVENSPLIVLAAGLVAGGVWIARRDTTPRYTWTVTKWSVGVAGGIAALYASVIALQLWAMGALKPWVLALDGVLFGSVVAFVVGVHNAERRAVHDELDERERSLREMYDVISEQSLTFEEKTERLVAIGRDLLDAEYGSFAHIDPETGEYTVEVVQSESGDVEAGDVVPLAETHCQRLVEEERTIQFETRPFDVEEKEYGTDVGFETYVGTPVYENDSIYGSLCFLDRSESEPFDDWQLTMVELMGNWMGYEINRKHLLEERQQELRQQEEKFEEFVDSVDNYAIFTLDTEGLVTSWNPGAERIKGYEESEIVGEHFQVFYPEADAERGLPEQLLAEAKETEKARHEGWRVRKNGERFWADVTIAARYDEHGEHVGYTKVVKDQTERREHERALEHERERLEFMNRILRHNILNGLNLVRARAELLDDEEMVADPDAREHARTIYERVDDLSGLVETMRSFMNAIVREADHETKPVAIRDALAEKVALAEDAYPDAVFETRDLPAADVRVVADELVGEVFENVLSNAVVHNDAETPRVRVWSSEATTEVHVDAETGELLPNHEAWPDIDVATEERDAVVVHVADNGPGIPDEEKHAVLKKGVSELQEPGNGFGLYLVKEMMSAYGGTVEVRDGDDGGAVFDLVFPEATRSERASASEGRGESER